MVTLNQYPSSKFFAALAKDLDTLHLKQPEFRYLTVENASMLNHAADIAQNIDILERYMERCILWTNSGEADIDLIYDLGQNLNNITHEADQPHESDQIDVREMLDASSLATSLDRLVALILKCELYPKSTVYNLVLMNALALLWMMYETVRIALVFFKAEIESPHFINKFLAQYEVTNMISMQENDDNKEFGLKFTRHPQQVVFTSEEKRAIAEEEERAAEEEKKITETYEEIQKTSALRQQLVAVVGDKVGECKTIDDCRRVKSLANLLRLVYFYNINIGATADEVMINDGWKLLTDIVEKPSDKSVWFVIGELTPYSIAYWMDKLFDKKLEASFMTSMETITCDPNEMYHFDKNSKVEIKHV